MELQKIDQTGNSLLESKDNQQKSVDDYRKAIQNLKQKLKKLEQINAQLQKEFSKRQIEDSQKTYDQFIKYAKDLNLKTIRIQACFKGYMQRQKFHQDLIRLVSSQNSKQAKPQQCTENTMKTIFETINTRHGLTFELIFRALDKNYEGRILSEDLKIQLLKYKLGLSNVQLTKLIYLFDEECTGFIQKEEFYNVLSTYCVLTETSIFQRSQELKVLQKICNLLIKNNMSPEDMFNACAKKKSHNILVEDLVKMMESMQQSFQEKELHAIYSVFSVEKNNLIEKIIFVKKLNSSLKQMQEAVKVEKMSTLNQMVQSDVRSNDSSLSFNSEKHGQKQSQMQLPPAQRQKIPSISLLQQQKQMSQAMIAGDDKGLKDIFQKLDNSKTPIYQFLESLLLSVNLSKRNLTVKDINAFLDQFYGEILSQKEKGILFRALDQDQNGNVDLNEIIIFFKRQSSVKRTSMRLILIYLAKKLELDGKSTEDYFTENYVQVDKRYSISEFHKGVAPLLGITGEDADKLFIEIDQEKKGNILIKNFIATINNYRSDQKPVLSQINEAKAFRSLEEMKILKSLLNEKGLSFHAVWLKSDVLKTGNISLLTMQNALKQILPEQPNNKIIYWLSLIDVNSNGQIDQQEFEMATATEESDLSAFRKTNGGPEKIENRDELINMFKQALKDKKLTPLDFFKFTDLDSSGNISILEMKNGIAALGLEFSHLIKLMQIFDQNQDGQLSLQEFMSILGDKFETDKAKEIRTILGVEYDSRADLNANKRLDEFGDETPDELKDALYKFLRFIKKQGGSMDEAYRKLFAEFDVNLDQTLSREEFLMGLDKYSKELKLTDRQKIRLMTLADKDINNKIDFKEFSSFLQTIRLPEESDQPQQTSDIQQQQAIAKPAGFIAEKPQDKIRELIPLEYDFTKVKQEELVLVKLFMYDVENKDKLRSLKVLLKKQDKIQYGTINRKQLQNVIDIIGIQFTKIEMSQLNKFADPNNQNKIDIIDFLNLIKQTGIEACTNYDEEDYSESVSEISHVSQVDSQIDDLIPRKSTIDNQQQRKSISEPRSRRQSSMMKKKTQFMQMPVPEVQEQVKVINTFDDLVPFTRSNKTRHVGPFEVLKSKLEKDIDVESYQFVVKDQKNSNFRRKTVQSSMLSALKVAFDFANILHENYKFGWIDPEFGPNVEAKLIDKPAEGTEENKEQQASQMNTNKGIQYIFNSTDQTQNFSVSPQDIAWLPAEQIFGKNDLFQKKGITRCQQGIIDDLWILGTLCIINDNIDFLKGDDQEFKINKEMLYDGIYPQIFHMFADYGIFVFKFFIQGQYRYVLVDDLLPCYIKNNQVVPICGIYDKSHGIVSALIIKAYAKLYQTYEQIHQGSLEEAILDFTGCPTIQNVMPQLIENEAETQINDYWVKLNDQLKKKHMIQYCCYTNSSANNGTTPEQVAKWGILPYRCLQMLAVVEIPDEKCRNKHLSHRLVILKNNWDDIKWKGNWCQGHQKYQITNIFQNISDLLEQSEVKIETNLINQENLIIMNYKSWRTIFGSFYSIMKITRQIMCKKYESTWNDIQAAGLPQDLNDEKQIISYSNNPQVKFTIKSRGDVFIVLQQQYFRIHKLLQYPFMDYIHEAGLILFKNDQAKINKYDSYNIVQKSSFNQSRDNFLNNFFFDKRSYSVVASTNKPGLTGNIDIYFYFENSDMPSLQFQTQGVKDVELFQELGDIQDTLWKSINLERNPPPESK